MVIIIPAVPPVPNGSNPLQGNSQINKVDFHGFGDIVRKLRAAGGTHISIAEELNTTLLVNNSIKLSSSGVWRWMRDNITEDDDYRTDNSAINIYLEESQMLKSVSKQVEIIESAIDAVNRGIKKDVDILSVTRQLKELALTYEKLLSNKQRLVTSIGVTQEKIYSFINYDTIINIIMDMVKQKDTLLHAEIVEEISKNPVLKECCRKINVKG